MNKQQQSAYLRDLGRHCPYCKKTGLLVGDLAVLEGEDGQLEFIVRCDSCKKRWVDIYRLTGVRASEPGEDPNEPDEED